MVRILVTGAGGFVGGHLLRHLRDAYPDAELHGTYLDTPKRSPVDVQTHTLDLREPDAVTRLIREVQPLQIYHLAGQSFVPHSFEYPWDTLEINVRAQLNLILGCLAADLRPRMLVTGSAEVYGIVTQVPITEDAPLQPTSPYSVSKVAQDMLALQYAHSHDMPTMRVRAFNHFGPGQNERFVAPTFAMQIARIEAGMQEPVLRVGDLSAQRDFTDVRDIVRAYRLLVEQGTPGAAYNVASGTAHSIQSVLDTLLRYTRADIQVTIDETRLRPSRLPILLGDITRLQQATNWQPQISFTQTLMDVMEDARQRITPNEEE